MNKRHLKDLLYEQVARIGKTLSSPKRLEIIELLAQGEKTVEALAAEVNIDIKLASAHLRALREACLVESRREGKYVVCKLKGTDIATLWIALRDVAQEHLVELKVALDQWLDSPSHLTPLDRKTLLQRARRNEVVVLDVRPEMEFRAGHLPFARSMPVDEIQHRLGELPKDKEIVAYCRGAFCLMSDEAAKLLTTQGYRVRKMAEGITDWVAAGLPVETEPSR